LPDSEVHSILNESSDLLTKNVDGTLPLKDTLLFVSLHSPSLPSLKDNDTGTLASLTIVAQDVNIKIESRIVK